MFDLARAGDLTLLSYIAAGLPADLTNQRGDTLLMLAAYHGHLPLVRGLLSPPPAPKLASGTVMGTGTGTGSDKTSNTPSTDTAAQATEGKEGAERKDAAGHDAAAARRPVRLVQPADPNRLNGKGQSILAGAIFKGEVEVARALVEAGADPLAGTPSGAETARLFSAEETYGPLFASAPGRGKGGVPAPQEV